MAIQKGHDSRKYACCQCDGAQNRDESVILEIEQWADPKIAEREWKNEAQNTVYYVSDRMWRVSFLKFLPVIIIVVVHRSYLL